jgi:hypothetical protein
MTKDPQEQTLSDLNPIESLEDRFPWTMGIAGMLKWLSWQPKEVIGVEKKELVSRGVAEAMEKVAEETFPNVFDRRSKNLKSLQDKIYAKISADIPRAEEIQLRRRLDSEDYLNKEFDVFLSLLPDSELTKYFRNVFGEDSIPESRWNIFGNGHEFPKASKVYFMQMDTIAYGLSRNNPNQADTLVCLELKNKAPFKEKQILQYCYMFYQLKEFGLIKKDATMRFLLIDPKSYSRETLARKASEFLHQSSKDYPNGYMPKCKPTRVKEMPKDLHYELMEKFKPQVSDLLSGDLSWFQTTTWDELGTYFYNTTVGEDHEDCERQEMYNKLVFGFLESLKNKVADKNTPLYQPNPEQIDRWSSRDPL